MSSQNGKGSRYRPKSVNQETWDKNWNLIFGKEKNSNQKTKHNNHIPKIK